MIILSIVLTYLIYVHHFKRDFYMTHASYTITKDFAAKVNEYKFARAAKKFLMEFELDVPNHYSTQRLYALNLTHAKEIANDICKQYNFTLLNVTKK